MPLDDPYQPGFAGRYTASENMTAQLRLRHIDFWQQRGHPSEWSLEGLDLGTITLLVGKNSSGKTKTLNLIRTLAKLVSGARRLSFLGSADFVAVFDLDGNTVRYELSYDKDRITREYYQIGTTVLLERGQGGVGKVFTTELNKMMDFQSPDRALAVVARRDNIQHKFLEHLYEWGRSVVHYQFGTDLGKQAVIMIVKGQTPEVDWRDTDSACTVFRDGLHRFPDTFKESVIRDMKAVGYDLEDIGTSAPVSMVINEPLPGDVFVLFVKERNLPSVTDQHDMSQGMFRALSIVININYASLLGGLACILIDDIGEGLDFERSCALIHLLMEKSTASNFQVILSTNDRFVMNSVPLEMWSVLVRDRNHVKVRNYKNSRAAFDKFRLTGLNNFDFLATDFR